MAVTIAVESALQDEVRILVASLNGYLKPLSPPEFQFQLTAEQMADEDTTVFVVRDDTGEAAGIGALKVHDAALGEVKRMFTTPAVRGSGAGWKILRAIETRAHDLGLARLVFETGSTTDFEQPGRSRSARASHAAAPSSTIRIPPTIAFTKRP
ncbi:GNAT family N-acetyltransferase [Aurantimonas marina]|uniref:GNAT family N-acetyltransferase n=1 Tax=Aurantimonas marina TaxID=2780508 RepID=UPI0038CC018F